eukprot:TRINITY_DN14491_c0_g1_i1.p1 TRINITY_DN14491_c0_g1~~TRINITY_DN14491_c0_g1_i1.p1  ORF type:complete len:590 (-),score=132.58 TRINITY_DN14491_c0_g1_i1:17-1672(-)
MTKASGKRKADDGIAKSVKKRSVKPKTTKSELIAIDIEDLARLYPNHTVGIHHFSDVQSAFVRTSLLSWYDQLGRDLPWRSHLKDDTPQKRAYGVWVSEIMCQQTRVQTVIDYWTRWMAKWPTVAALAKATQEEVNEMWAGLGYYRRARFLLQGAQEIMSKHNGLFPSTAKELQAISGIGEYTAGAIASVVFGEAAPIVDGNVVRVVSRLRAIAGDIKTPQAKKLHWRLARELVSEQRPGDFNQALMELGAILCTPQKPNCGQCPVRAQCWSYALANPRTVTTSGTVISARSHPKPTAGSAIVSTDVAASAPIVVLDDDVDETRHSMDIGDAIAAHSCSVCGKIPVITDVTQIPPKVVKAAKRDETLAVCVLEHVHDAVKQYLLVQRPESGLLAGLWDFPSVVINDADDDAATAMTEYLAESLCVPKFKPTSRRHVGEATHLFTHIKQVLRVEHIRIIGSVPTADTKRFSTRWVTAEELPAVAMSTGMKKAFALVMDGATKVKAKRKAATPTEALDEDDVKPKKRAVAKTAKVVKSGESKKQTTLMSMFKK